MQDFLSIAIDRNHIGYARVDNDLRVLERRGRLTLWLPEPGGSCCECALLFGMEQELRAICSGERTQITLPGIQMPEIGKGLRASIVISWDRRHNSYFILVMADHEADEIEALLTAERRNKQMSDERLLAETERANVQTRINAVAQERARIARDLHDTLIQSMVGVLMQVRLAVKMMLASPERALEVLASAEIEAREGLDNARRTLGEIRTETAESITLGAKVREALAHLRAQLNIGVNLQMDTAADDLHGEIAQGVARVAQEALRNVERHARAREIALTLRVESDGKGPVARLIIVDDGVGFDPHARYEGHFGLVGMREQVDILGGSLHVESAPGRGARIDATIPLPQKDFGNRV